MAFSQESTSGIARHSLTIPCMASHGSTLILQFPLENQTVGPWGGIVVSVH